MVVGHDSIVGRSRLDPRVRARSSRSRNRAVRADAPGVTDRIVLSPDALRLLRSAEVITEAANRLNGDVAGWERDELLDTIEMHAGAVKVAVGVLR